MKPSFLNTNGNWLALILLALISFTNAQIVFGQEEIISVRKEESKLPSKYYFLITDNKTSKGSNSAFIESLYMKYYDYNFHYHQITETSYFPIEEGFNLVVFTSREDRKKFRKDLLRTPFSELSTTQELPKLTLMPQK